MSAAVEVATMTPNFGKRVIDLGAEPKLLRGEAWNRDNHSSPENAAMETARLGLTTEISFKIGFSFSLVSQIISRG